MNVAIIGARRAKNGIGEYIANYFQKNGAPVVCVLGTTEETSLKASRFLGKYGITARPYHDFTEMVSREDIQAVAIASPPESHLGFLKASLARGLSVFCEKPFLDPSRADLSDELDNVFGQAGVEGKTIAMNSQWPFCLGAYEELCGLLVPAEVRRFSIRLSPICSGLAMIPDSVPHALSILHTALGPGALSRPSFSGTDTDMTIEFTYTAAHGSCAVTIALIQESEQPRPFWFGFDDRIAQRSIETARYEISFHSAGRRLPVADPLELCVRDFIEACSAGREPVIGREHIVATTRLLKQIYDAYSLPRQ
ncbi:MAG: Gfo/Idh/MocA family oxidoreductase [Desulfomonilia bacterium]|nr:Gfo/Idh/MocA family oxidoreductase [Deltaproteobacteria bacterium]